VTRGGRSAFSNMAMRPRVGDRHSPAAQTGTGKLHTTAISTAAITAVIFSLVDRSMVSSERDANLSAALYAASRAYAVTAITLRPVASRRRAPLLAFGAWHTSQRPGPGPNAGRCFPVQSGRARRGLEPIRDRFHRQVFEDRGGGPRVACRQRPDRRRGGGLPPGRPFRFRRPS
jgi:hypothetical protein